MKEKGKIGQDRAGFLEKPTKMNLLYTHYGDCSTKINISQQLYNYGKYLFMALIFRSCFRI